MSIEFHVVLWNALVKFLDNAKYLFGSQTPQQHSVTQPSQYSGLKNQIKIPELVTFSQNGKMQAVFKENFKHFFSPMKNCTRNSRLHMNAASRAHGSLGPEKERRFPDNF
jgi:hypothetical protein